MRRYWQYRGVGSAKWFLAEFGRPGDILNSVYSIFRSIAQYFQASLLYMSYSKFWVKTDEKNCGSLRVFCQFFRGMLVYY